MDQLDRALAHEIMSVAFDRWRNLVISDDLISTLQGLIWEGTEKHRLLQQHGISLTPSNFYSTIPSLSEIESTFEDEEPFPYAATGLFDPGRMRVILEEIRAYSHELIAPRQDDENQPEGFFWDNGQFGYSDAISYYSLIRSRKPKRILEIGAGFSTLLASRAVEENGFGEIICIEPFPRPFLGTVPYVKEVIRKPVQAISPEWINSLLSDGDFLFIDSTHTVKIGSDCLHIYLRILPKLTHDLLIHVHDVFLPEGMPKEWALPATSTGPSSIC